MTLNQGHISKVKVTMHSCLKSVSGPFVQAIKTRDTFTLQSLCNLSPQSKFITFAEEFPLGFAVSQQQVGDLIGTYLQLDATGR